MKKKTWLLIVAVIIFLCTTGFAGFGKNSKSDSKSTDLANDEQSWAVSEADIPSILFHQPYLDAANISANNKSDREKMPDKITEALQGEPYRAVRKDGGLFSTDYYAITSGSGEYYYYGKISDNKPDGFGVLAWNAIDLNDLDSISGLVYAGNFKKGIFNGYGAQFNSTSSNNTSTYVSAFISDGLLEKKYADIATSYLQSYVVYDGGWKNGKENGKGNFFQFDYVLLNQNIQEDYWGGTCYPTVTVTDVKNGSENGNSKLYVCGILIYDGKTKNGVEHGKGISYYSNGQIKYNGQWKNGKYNGKGKLYDEDGTLI